MTKLKCEDLWKLTIGKVTEVEAEKYTILNYLENSTLFFRHLKVGRFHPFHRPRRPLGRVEV
jgi:hypothetical protein